MSPSRIHADGDFGVVAKRDLGWRIPIAGKADMQRLGEAIHSAIACDNLVRNAAHSVALSVFLPKHPSRPLPAPMLIIAAFTTACSIFGVLISLSL